MKILTALLARFSRSNGDKKPDAFDQRLQSLSAPMTPARGRKRDHQPAPVLFRRAGHHA